MTAIPDRMRPPRPEGRHAEDLDKLAEAPRHSSEAARPAVDMLLAAWSAATGRPAYVTSTVSDLLGRPARTFRQWATDHATSVHRGPS
ncbi:hypothetical protein ACH495_06635 [Micromonospora sp. NPDC018662]|uniref:hypothetical protein n=1 Tax=Micromonospora sp. NPDC018662 TaxID=3364238 RepID=UPI00378C2B00